MTTINTLNKINEYQNQKKLLSRFHELSFLDFKDDLEPSIKIWPDFCAVDQYTIDFFNELEVKKALHVRTSMKYKDCNGEFYKAYKIGESYNIYKDILIPSGKKVWFYSGDTDRAVPFKGTIKWITKLALKITEEFRGWKVNGQVAGT
jgi:hypothetical protein